MRAIIQGRSMNMWICLAVVAGMGVLSAVPTQAAEATLSPSKDNTLYEPIQQDALEIRSNAVGDSMFTGRVKDALNASGQVAVRRGVLAFDLSSIPPGSTINSVTLRMQCTKAAQSTGFSAGLHRLTSDWGEGTSNTGNSQQGRGEAATANDATWEHTFFDTQFWTTNGGDYVGSASGSLSVGGLGTYTWGSTAGLVADVQAWVDSPVSNFGWIVIGDETQNETAKKFASRENGTVANRPLLTVDFTTGEISGGCCQGDICTIETAANCLTLAGVYQGDGTSCSPNPCVDPLGACCASEGTCSESEQLVCEGGGGIWQGAGSTCATVACPVQLTPYIDPLPIPAVASPVSGSIGGTATYDMAMREFSLQMHSELPNPTTVWGYDDGTGPSFPGPTIVARQGLPVTVNWSNDLREGGTGPLRTDHYLAQSSDDLECIHGAEDNAQTVVHLHGGHVPAAVDGYPEHTSVPGALPETYVYPNGQQAGFLWYHDHALGTTRLNVYMGLAGGYLVRDAVEDAINIPAGAYEVPLVLQDRTFNPDGSLFYPPTWQDMFFGDKAVVNGKVWPYLDVDQGKYRFKLLGGATSRVWTLTFNGPGGLVPFTAIGTEGGLLQAPASGLTELTIGGGERYEVILDFEPFSAGDEIFLENSAPAPFPNGSVDLTEVMKFVVGSQLGDTDPIPSTLRPIEQLQESDAIMSRDFLLKKTGTDACGRSYWRINDKVWDDITEYPELGTTEIWRFINDSNVSHPMHMHLVFFQILDRDGFTTGGGGEIIPDGNPQPPEPQELGWKDTAMVGPGEIVRVIARFEDYKGKYAYHCHILEHEDHEMMRQFQTVQCGDAVLDPLESCDDGNLKNLDGCSRSCEIESFTQLEGIASGNGGGRVDLVIAGELIRVGTQSGDTAQQVAAALAAAINANANLQALGISAVASAGRVVVNAEISSMDIRDNGLENPLPLEVTATQLWWGNVDAGASTTYDVVSGDLGQLLATAGFASPLATTGCLADNQDDTALYGLAVPDLGDAIWYLIRAQAGGSYDTGAASQTGPRDIDITASGNDCP
jgi:spore coat protein A